MQRDENEAELNIPVRLTDEARVATWNPGVVRATRVILRVRDEGGEVTERVSMNSGRARVRTGERIEGVRAVADNSSA